MQSSWQRDIDSMVHLLSFKQRSHCRAGSACVCQRGWGPGVWVRAVPGVRARAGTCAGISFTLCWGCTALPGYRSALTLQGLGAQHSKIWYLEDAISTAAWLPHHLFLIYSQTKNIIWISPARANCGYKYSHLKKKKAVIGNLAQSWAGLAEQQTVRFVTHNVFRRHLIKAIKGEKKSSRQHCKRW